MKQLMSGIVPDPFQVSSKTIVTDENVTRDDAEDGDDAAEAQIDPERFTELAEKFGSKVSGMALAFFVEPHKTGSILLRRDLEKFQSRLASC